MGFDLAFDDWIGLFGYWFGGRLLLVALRAILLLVTAGVVLFIADLLLMIVCYCLIR